MSVFSYSLKGIAKIIAYILNYAFSDIGDEFKNFFSEIKNDIKNDYFVKINENIKFFLLMGIFYNKLKLLFVIYKKNFIKYKS